MKTLTPFERWMIRSNLATVAAGANPEDQEAILRANGYPHIADGLALCLKLPDRARRRLLAKVRKEFNK